MSNKALYVGMSDIPDIDVPEEEYTTELAMMLQDDIKDSKKLSDLIKERLAVNNVEIKKATKRTITIVVKNEEDVQSLIDKSIYLSKAYTGTMEYTEKNSQLTLTLRKTNKK